MMLFFSYKESVTIVGYWPVKTSFLAFQPLYIIFRYYNNKYYNNKYYILKSSFDLEQNVDK